MQQNSNGAFLGFKEPSQRRTMEQLASPGHVRRSHEPSTQAMGADGVDLAGRRGGVAKEPFCDFGHKPPFDPGLPQSPYGENAMNSAPFFCLRIASQASSGALRTARAGRGTAELPRAALRSVLLLQTVTIRNSRRFSSLTLSSGFFLTPPAQRRRLTLGSSSTKALCASLSNKGHYAVATSRANRSRRVGTIAGQG
jgi:hypothetical protein